MKRFALALVAMAACKSPTAPPRPAPASPAVSDGSAVAPPAPSAPAAAAAEARDAGLLAEEREANPGSEMVTVKLICDPKRAARVYWGRKDLGLAPLELKRPRNSGPLDLVVAAPGYLPLHVRAFTDRDERIALRLYTAGEASSLLGYRRE